VTRVHAAATREAAPAPVASALRGAAARAPASPLAHELEEVAARRPPVQAKLEVGAADDPLEREADRLADAVAGGEVAGGIVQRTCACGRTPGPDGECAECKARRLAVQQVAARDASPVAPDAESKLRAVRGGRPLAAGDRSFFESRLGVALGGVRVHDDAAADAAAHAVGALAYTLGSSVVFRRGHYVPESAAGRRLLAHELAHVVQQRADGGRVVRRQLPAAEAEADLATPAGARAESPLETESGPAPAGPEAVPAAEGAPPAAAPAVCEPNRALTWADFAGSPPAGSTFGALTVAPVSESTSGGTTTFRAKLNGTNSWVRARFKSPSNRAVNGCAQPIADCKSAFAKLAKGSTGTWSFDGAADPNCAAGIVPSSTPTAKSSGECDSVIGAECDRAAGLESQRLLRHEQLHMDISCQIAKKANAALAGGSKLADVRSAVSTKAQATQDSYDTESDHGCDATKQSDWETSVAGGLTTVTIP
jgi:hypothetical protein